MGHSRFASLGGVLALIGSLSGIPAQTSASVPPVDPYAGFVGDWSGTVRYLKDDTYITVPLKLHITELNKGHGLQFDYTYPKTSESPETRDKRVIRFDPAREKMTTHFGLFDEGEYDTEGLALFAARSLGAFQASAIPLVNGVPVAYHVEYLLTQELLMYTWHRSVSHQPFITIHHVSLQRVHSTLQGTAHP